MPPEKKLHLINQLATSSDSDKAINIGIRIIDDNFKYLSKFLSFREVASDVSKYRLMAPKCQ